MTCDRTNEVHAYHDGELPAAQREALEAHLRSCDACAALLDELRGLSRLVASLDFPPLPEPRVSRLYGAWHTSRQRGLLRVASGLTAAAAAVLFGALVFWQPGGTTNPGGTEVTSAAAPWEPAAVMPPSGAVVEDDGDDDELVQVAQWMADDLADIGGDIGGGEDDLGVDGQ